MGNYVLCFKHTVKLCKQGFHDIGLGQSIPEQPDGLRIGHSIPKAQAKEPHETHPVIDLVLRLIVGKVEEPSQHKNFDSKTKS